MALPPTIPTSFVPQSASATIRRPSDLTGAFGFLAYGVFAIVIGLAIGVFFYDRILVSTLAAKEAELKNVQASISPATVQSFVQLRDRLSAASTLLANHVAISGFFSVIGADLPTAVRFGSMHIAQSDSKKIMLTGAGTAASFNALASLSSSIAKAGHIKDAIFSGISINSTTKNTSVSFTLTATIDPSLVAFNPTAPTLPASTTSVAPLTP